jgi:predicted phosphodiesterase
MTKLELAKALIEEKSVDGVCTLSKKKLGEVLNKRYPDLFHSPENARSVVRVLTNAYGESKRNLKKSIRMEWNGFKLPEPETNDYSKYILDAVDTIIFSDIHFPYYDEKSLTAAGKYAIKKRPKQIILNGDIIDCYHMSEFQKDPRKRSIKYELDLTREWLQQLRALFPDSRIVYKNGNHCERYEKKILQRLPELIDLEWTTLEYALGLKQLGIEIVGNKKLMMAGNLNIGHGHEIGKGFIPPVNVARGFFLKTKSNFIGGHHHRTSEHMERDINNKIIGAWSTGCLCELHPEYMPINNWNHGFAEVEFYGSDFSVKNLKIIEGKVI